MSKQVFKLTNRLKGLGILLLSFGLLQNVGASNQYVGPSKRLQNIVTPKVTILGAVVPQTIAEEIYVTSFRKRAFPDSLIIFFVLDECTEEWKRQVELVQKNLPGTRFTMLGIDATIIKQGLQVFFDQLTEEQKQTWQKEALQAMETAKKV